MAHDTQPPCPVDYLRALVESAKANWRAFPDPLTEEEVEDMALADGILAACHAIASEVEATDSRTRLREISSSVGRALETIGTLSEWSQIEDATCPVTDWGKSKKDSESP